jgi:dihydrofolate reductase
MRKLIVEEWISLDGFISDSNGKLDFFASHVRQTYSAAERKQFLETIDCILFGRKTYEQFTALWPQRSTDNDQLAELINSEKKIVFSQTLKAAPWGTWPEAAVLRGDVIDHVKILKEGSGKNLVVWGSISLANTLMRARLIDEVHLHICPTLLGGGTRLFENGLDPAALNLAESKCYGPGIVLLKYEFLKSASR